MSEAIIHIDGAARGNPGPAAYAVVIERPGHATIEDAATIGTATNNVAEYTALVRALQLASELGIQNAKIFSDSELLVKQMNGEYRVKHPDLLPLYQEALHLKKQLGSATISHVRREQNKRADELGNIALDADKPKRMAGAPAKPKAVVSDAVVRGDAILCLESALSATNKPSAALVWEQLWSILEEGGVLKKVKK
jgi:ribonuclease HI